MDASQETTYHFLLMGNLLPSIAEARFESLLYQKLSAVPPGHHSEPAPAVHRESLSLNKREQTLPYVLHQPGNVIIKG